MSQACLKSGFLIINHVLRSVMDTRDRNLENTSCYHFPDEAEQGKDSSLTGFPCGSSSGYTPVMFSGEKPLSQSTDCILFTDEGGHCVFRLCMSCPRCFLFIWMGVLAIGVLGALQMSSVFRRDNVGGKRALSRFLRRMLTVLCWLHVMVKVVAPIGSLGSIHFCTPQRKLMRRTKV